MNKKDCETSYGTLNSKKLEELQQNFDTTKILAAVDTIEDDDRSTLQHERNSLKV
jgi:hypothetical protein